jgi:PmbA protein
MTDVNQVIDQALAILKKKSIDGYELYLRESSQFETESKDGKVDTLETSRSWGMAFRILNDQRMGFSYTTSSGQEGLEDRLERIIGDAIVSARATFPDPCFDLAPPLKDPLPHLPIFDENLERVSEMAKIEKTRRLEEAARSVDPERIRKVRKASYQESLSKKTFINSNGLSVSYASTLASVSVTAVAEVSGASEVGWDFDQSHFFNDLDVEKAGKAAAKRALERLGGRGIPSGASIDGEGMPSRRKSLVLQGEISGYLYDRYWANRENISSAGPRAESTGNSRRSSVKSPPGLGVSNFFIEPGKPSLTALFESLHQGLVVEDVMGIHTVDPISGDFSLGCSGDWVGRGEKQYPVKSIAIAGNLFDLFQKVEGVGEDLRFFGGVGSPSLLIESLEVSGR